MDLQLLDSIIECSICLDRLKHDARVLPCQHTFCLDCLRVRIHQRTCREHESQMSSFSSKTFLQRVANKNPNTPLACPECRQQTNIFDIDLLPRNVFLIRLLDQITQKSNGSTDKGEGISTPITTTTKPNDPDKKLSPLTKSMSDSQQQPTSVPYAKALYDFQMKPIEDEGCLKFQKGMIIQVTRRVDQNWAEGKLNDIVGIFPLSFVHMNQAATELMKIYATKWRLPASMPSTSSNDQNPSTSSPQRQFLQKPPLQPTPAHPILIRPTSPPSSSQNPPLSISQDKTGVYIALHNYMPQKPDELELKKGSQYIVKEACQDGWFKGSCSDNLFTNGVFPGNYVMPLLYHQKMMSMQRNAALQAQKNQTNSSTQHMRTTGAYTNLGLSAIPPELPQRNLTGRTTQSPLSQLNKPEATSEISPNAQTQKTDDNVNKLKRESMTEMLMKKLGYNRKSNDSSAYSMDNPVFEDSSSASSTKPKQTSLQYNHMRSGSCPIDLSLTDANIENMQFGSQRVKTRQRSALLM